MPSPPTPGDPVGATDPAGPRDAVGATDPGNGRPVSSRGRRRRAGGVSVIAGGLLQDLEERLRRDLAPIEERVRPGEEIRGLGGRVAGDAAAPLVVVLPPTGEDPARS